MGEYLSTADVSIFDDDSGYHAQVDSDRDFHTKSKLWDGSTEVGVTSDNRLKVEGDFDDEVSISEYRGTLIIRHLILDGSEPYTFVKGSMDVDGSVTPQNFYRTPPSGKKWFIAEVRITIEGSSINHTKFGSIAALTNGILFKVTEGGVERDFYEHAIKTNGTFRHVATDVKIDSSTTDMLSVTLDFRGMGTTLLLKNSTSDNFKIVVQDDLTGIDFMEATIFGYEVDE